MTIERQYLNKLRTLNIEQEILVDEFLARFDLGEGDAFNITAFEPLLYEGAIAGSEFLTYDANKMYLCFDFVAGFSAGANNANCRIVFYDEGNAIILQSQNASIAYEAVAAAIFYGKNDTEMKNLYFSRINPITYNYMKFIGYRITY